MAKGPGGFSVGRVSVKVVPDTSDFRRDLIRELKAAVKGVEVEIPVKLNMKGALAQLKLLDQLLKKVDRTVTPTVNMKTDIKQGGLDTLNKNLNKLKDGSNQASEGFGKMSHALLITVAVFLLAAPLIALVATLLAGLPSLLLAVLAPIAAVSLGMEGFSKAAEKFQPTIDRLKKSLSQNFQDGLTPVFQRLNKLAPVLDVGLNKVADGLIHILDQLSRMVTAPDNMKLLENILKNIGSFLTQISVALNNGTLAFLKLASVASDSFGILTTTLNNFSSSFLDMVNGITQTGQLKSALEGLNKVLAALLEGFVKLFESGIKAMAVLGGPMADFLSTFINLIVRLMPALTALSKLVFDVLAKAFEALAPVVDALTPGFEVLAKFVGIVLIGAINAVKPLLIALANIISTVLTKAFATLEPFLPKIMDFLLQLGTLLADSLLAAFTALTPFLEQFLQFITNLLTELTPLLPALVQFADEVLKALVEVFKELGPQLVELGKDLFPQLLTVIKDLVPMVSDLIKMLIEILPPLTDLAIQILKVAIPATKEFLNVIKEVWPSIKQIIEGTLLQIRGLIDLVMGIITGDWDRAWNGLGDMLRGAWEVFKGIIKTGIAAFLDFFVGLPARIAAQFGLVTPEFAKSGRAMMQGLIDGIKAMANSVINAALSVVDRIRDLLPFSPAKTGPFSGKGYTLYSGIALMEDWARGIKKGGAAALSAVDNVVGATAGSMELEANIAADGFGSIGDKVAAALAQWGIQIDANGLARMVNKVNRKDERR